MRVFEQSGLLLHRLRWDEWLILGGYALLVVWPRLLPLVFGMDGKLSPSESAAAATFVTGFLMGSVCIAFSPGTRFRNVYFSGVWFVLSTWLVFKSGGTVIEPVVLLLFYHGIRWHFWRRYQREWIPATVSRTGYDRDYYRVEKRYSSFEDIRYTKFLFRVGMVLLFASWVLPAGVLSQ